MEERAKTGTEEYKEIEREREREEFLAMLTHTESLKEKVSLQAAVNLFTFIRSAGLGLLCLLILFGFLQSVASSHAFW